MRFIWVAVVASLGLTFVAPAAAQTKSPDPALTGLGIRLLEAPTDRRNDPRAQVYIVDHVPSGTALSRRVEVVNRTGRDARVSLYPAASEVSDGSFQVLPGAGENQLTGWMRVTPATIELAAGASAAATVEIDVPGGVGGGERYAAVMAEVVERSDQPGIAIANRVGVRVYLSVGGAEEPASDFEISTLQAARQPDGRPTVTAQVRNTGQRALDLSGLLSLTEGPGGLSAGPFPAELGTTLAPGESSPVDIVLDRAIRGGPWLATLTLRSGTLERSAAARTAFPEEAGAQTDPVAAQELPLAKDPNVLIPAAGALIALIALLLLLLLFRGRRTKDREGEPAASQDRLTEGLCGAAQ